jgi:N-methylhydantoinase A
MTKALEVGVDIGGTFTDVVSRDEEGNLKYFKVLTTRKDESIAVLGSIQRVCEEWDADPKVIERFVHGTTVATNAILERKGARPEGSATFLKSAGKCAEACMTSS